MKKALFSAAVAASLTTSLVATVSAPAEAHRRHRVVAAAVIDAPVVGGCGAFLAGCGVRTCRPAAYYDMSYPYAFASMTPTFGLRGPRVRTCW